MLRRDRQRIAEAELVGFEPAGLARFALALVGGDDRGLARLADQIGEHPIIRHQTGAPIDQEEHRVGLFDRRLGLLDHAAGQARGRRAFEARGVDRGEFEVAETPVALATVARHARHVVDQCKPLADQAVEQRRLADVRPANDGDGEAHGSTLGHSRRRVARGRRFFVWA